MSRRRVAGRPPRQRPYRRHYANGRGPWVSRYADRNGKRKIAKPRWNGGKGTFEFQADAQRAIDEALAQEFANGPAHPETIGGYFAEWPRLHPRSTRTNDTNKDRISRLLDVEVDGRPLRDWEFDELRRRQVLALVDHMLRAEGRAARGVRGILSAFSAMAEDAIGDDVAAGNAFMGVRLRRNDPRISKPPRKIRVWSFEQMRAFAVGGRPAVRARTKRPDSKWGRCYPPHDYEAMLLTPGLTGLRLGEFLALMRADFNGESFRLRFAAHEGELVESSEEKNHERAVPVPPSLARLIESRPTRIDTDLLFPTPTGKLWRDRNFYRDVWVPAQVATGLDPTPHEFRHSYITHLHARGIDPADLALVAGHRIETMMSVYTHALEKSHDAIRRVIG